MFAYKRRERVREMRSKNSGYKTDGEGLLYSASHFVGAANILAHDVLHTVSASVIPETAESTSLPLLMTSDSWSKFQQMTMQRRAGKLQYNYFRGCGPLGWYGSISGITSLRVNEQR